MAKKLKYEIDFETRRAARELQDLAEGAGDVEDGFEEAESAGVRMARVIESKADDMIDEIDQTAKAVKALDRALGPEFDGDTRDVVRQLRNVGLTAQDIEGDADELAAALRRAGDVKTHATQQGFDDVEQALGGVRDETGRTRGAMTGFAGGVIGEMPGVADSIGPVGEAMGQLVEGALEGEVPMKNLGTAALGIGAAGAGFVLVQKAMASMAETKAFDKEQVESFRDAIDEVGEGVRAVDQALDDTVEGRAGGWGPFFEQTKDITALLLENEIAQSDVNEAIGLGGEALDAVVGKLQAKADAQLAANIADNEAGRFSGENTRKYRELEDAIEILKEKREAYTKAVEDGIIRDEYSALTQEKVNQTLADIEIAADPIAHVRDEMDRMARMLANGVAPAVSDVDAAMELLGLTEAEVIELAIEHNEALGETVDLAEDTVDAVDEITDAFAELREELDDRSAYLNLETQFDRFKETAGAAWTATAEGADDAEQKAREFELAMINLKQKVLDFAEEAGNIDPQITAEIIALIDEGSYAEAERRLAALERVRQVRVQVTNATPSTYVPPAPTTSGGNSPDGQPANASFTRVTNTTINVAGMTAADVRELKDQTIRYEGVE